MTNTVRESVTTAGKFLIGLVLPVAIGLAALNHVVGIDLTNAGGPMTLAFGWFDLVIVLGLFLFILIAMPYLPRGTGRR